jgi:hypothetical protein
MDIIIIMGTISILMGLGIHGLSYWHGYKKGYIDAKKNLPPEYKVKKIEIGDNEML